MKKIGLVIDSTTILNPIDIEEYCIEVVSLNVIYKNESQKEKDLSEEFIIANLDDVKSFKTASPNPQDFLESFGRLWQKGFQDIIVVPLSKELSSTYQTAILAKEIDENGEHIHVIDTNICNFGNANLIETMLPLFKSDMDAQELVNEFNQRAKNSQLLFTVNDLKHLFHGGRLSKLSAVLGTLLKIKPIIEMIEGKLKLSYKVRHTKAMFDIFMQYIKKYVDNYQNVFLKIVHLQNIPIMEKLTELVNTQFNKIKVSIIDRVNPVFLTHLGNDGIGIALTGF